MPDTVTPSLAEGEKLLARYAKLAAASAGHEADLADAIAQLKKFADRKIARIGEELDELKARLEPWWRAHGETITKGKKKSHELAGCVIGIRANPQKLMFAGDGEAAAIEALQGAGLGRLVKKVPQLDKKAIMAQLEAKSNSLPVLGFSILKGETFFVDLATRSRKA